MSKQEFLTQLRKGLSGLPQNDIEERLTFYSEMIEDQMEEGISEDDAVSSAGSVDEIVAQAVAETPLMKISKEKSKSKRQPRAGEIVLLVLGSPILGIAVFAVILSLYISLWAVMISLWSVFAALIGCSVCGLLACAVFIANGIAASGFAMLATGIVCAGLAIFMFYGCKATTTGILILTKNTAIRIKNCFRGKEAVS